MDKRRMPFTKEHKRKISEAHIGMKKPWAGKGSLGKHHTEEWKIYISKKMRIENARRIKNGTHNFWKGGITPLLIKIRKILQYRAWRFNVFTRDNFTCRSCGKSSIFLEAHHIKQFAEIIHANNIKNINEAINCIELWNLDNGMTLCQECHGKTASNNKNYFRKKTAVVK